MHCRRFLACLRFGVFFMPCIAWCVAGISLAATPGSTSPEAGIRNREPTKVAIVNAQVCVSAGQPLALQTIVIEGGTISAVGPHVTVPDEARIIDLDGKFIYPALIDPYSEISVPDPRTASVNWNSKAQPHRRALSGWKRNASVDKAYREAGFGLRLVAPDDGVLRGTSAVVTTSDERTERSVVRDQVAQHLRLATRGSRNAFPNSPMGAVALARQAFYDALWYDRAWRAFNAGQAPRPESNDALAALNGALQQDQLFVFTADDEQYALRANRFAVEFQLNRVAILASGREYQRLDAVVETGRPLIVPVNFSKAPNVSTVEAAEDATLADLLHWHFAPENPARLHDAGATIVLTSHGLGTRTDFRQQVRKAVERGLPAAAALRACTWEPAKLLGIDHVAGSLHLGRAANLMVTDGPWLDEKSKVVETWIDGTRYQHRPQPTTKMAGSWQLNVRSTKASNRTLYLDIQDKNGKSQGNVWRVKPHQPSDNEPEGKDSKETADDQTPPEFVKLERLHLDHGRLTAKFSGKLWQQDGAVHLTVTAAQDAGKTQLFGTLRDTQGNTLPFTGTRFQTPDETGSTKATERAGQGEVKEASPVETSPDEFPLSYPLGAFGVTSSQQATQTVVFENATIWSCGEAGVFNGSLLVRDGKIVAIGEASPGSQGCSANRCDRQAHHSWDHRLPFTYGNGWWHQRIDASDYGGGSDR